LRTNTEKIDWLMSKVIQIETQLEERSIHHQRDIDYSRELLAELEESGLDHDKKLASLEEKIKFLEKSNDRTWQFVPLVISAVAILVSLFVAFLKK
jgi:hypothetical protein